ncbi:MAG: hypothetical protein ACTSSG_04255 [Candidatus Heimdallarchaeaceae archaeon]
MKCAKCGRYADRINDQKYYCKKCHLLYYFLIPGKVQVFKMFIEEKV